MAVYLAEPAIQNSIPSSSDIVWRDDSWQKLSRELAGHPFVVEQRERVGQVGASHEMEVA